MSRLILIPFLLVLAPGGPGAASAARPGAIQPRTLEDQALGHARDPLAPPRRDVLLIRVTGEEGTGRILGPGQLPPDDRYPGTVFCIEHHVVYPRVADERARAFCSRPVR